MAEPLAPKSAMFSDLNSAADCQHFVTSCFIVAQVLICNV